MEAEVSGLLINSRFALNYEEWVSRERRIRIKILKDSPVIRERGILCACDNCGEVCLCHEQNCPNCNSCNIIEKQIDGLDAEMCKRIRCHFRFEHLP